MIARDLAGLGAHRERRGWAIACNLCHGRPIAGVAMREGCVSPEETLARSRFFRIRVSQLRA